MRYKTATVLNPTDLNSDNSNYINIEIPEDVSDIDSSEYYDRIILDWSDL